MAKVEGPAIGSKSLDPLGNRAPTGNSWLPGYQSIVKLSIDSLSLDRPGERKKIMSARHSESCPSCGERGTVERASAWWKVALVAGYVVFSAMVFGASLLGPTIMAVLPLVAGCGIGLLPYLHDKAGAPATCTSCHRIVPNDATTTRRPTVVHMSTPPRTARVA